MDDLRIFMEESAYMGVFLTVFLYLAFCRLHGRFSSPLLNPLLLTMASLICLLLIFELPYEAYEPSGDMITWFLTPATVCFAVPLYRQVKLLRRHAAAILISIFTGSLASVGSIFLMSRLFDLPFEIYASLAPKSVTMPIATSIAGEMDAVLGCTVVAVILTGLLGSLCTSILKKLLRIRSHIAWGVATGTSSHAIGTSAVMAESEVAGAMSSLSIAIAGLMTVVIVPVLSGLYA